MSRRALTLVTAGILAVIIGVIGAVLPVPYVVLSPGPTVNTLGKDDKGQPLIQVQGHQTYATSGHLNLVTVTYQGGPGDELDLFTALRGWLSTHDAVVPQQELFPPNSSPQQVQQQNVQQMTDSQQLATAAALSELKIGFRTVVSIAQTAKGMPAYGVLHPGDLITAVDGKPVSDTDVAAKMISDRSPGSPVTVTVSHGGTTRQVRLLTKASGGHAVIGVVVQGQYKFPFTVKIKVNDIGGPSAGMMFALGLIDKLTPTDLTGGRFIAGTGEIEANGNVDPIGGIQQKMVGARGQGATVFLTPAANCGDAVSAAPAGLRLVKVNTLHDAVQDLLALRAGKPVPAC